MLYLYYALDEGEHILIGEVLTNHSMSVDDMLNLLDIDMDVIARLYGWDDWDWDSLYISTVSHCDDFLEEGILCE